MAWPQERPIRPQSSPLRWCRSHAGKTHEACSRDLAWQCPRDDCDPSAALSPLLLAAFATTLALTFMFNCPVSLP